MKNYVQAGVNLTLPAPYAVASGDGALIGAIFGVASQSALEGEDVDLVTDGVFSLPKVVADEFTIGERAYWDDAAQMVTVTALNNTLIGVAIVAAGNGVADVSVRLNGAF